MVTFSGSISGGRIGSGSSRFRARTGSTPVKKKKQKTIFGFKIGPPPKSDQQKRVERGATTIATKSVGGKSKIITTPTMDNKSLIMSKATQQKTAQEYKSSTANLAKAKKKIGNLLNPPSAPANPSMGVRRMDPSGTKSVSVLEKSGPVYKGQTLTQYKPKTSGITIPEVKQTKLAPIDGNEKGISKISTPPKGPITSGIMSQPTLLRGGDKGTKSGGTFASKEARQLLANAVREGKGQYQGVLPTATTNFMGQKRRVAKVGSNFFRIKSNRRLAKDPMSGIQLKYFKNQLAKGTNELKWSLVK